MTDGAGTISRMSRVLGRRGWMMTVAVVVVVLAGLVITIFGLGPDDHAVASGNGNSWLWSTEKGELARVNAETGRVDTRFRVTDAQGHLVEVVQTDGHVILRDQETGQVSTIDLSTLQVSATTKTTAGVGISVALRGDTAFIIDAVQGVVRQLDAATLIPIGEPLRFPPGLTGGVFDTIGNLWLALPDEGTVVAITPSISAAGSARATSTFTVAQPGHDLVMSALDNGVAVLDNTGQSVTTIRAGQKRVVPLSITSAAIMPTRSAGSLLAVTVRDGRRVYVFDAKGAVHTFTVPGSGTTLAPGIAFAGRFYCADNSSGTVYVLDEGGKLVDTITIARPGGPLQLEVHGSDLYINAPGSSSARVVDDHNRVRIVDKYANGIPGGDPPPNPPAPPRPPAPRVGPPGVPTRITAIAGNAQATVSWGTTAPNGSAILRFVVEGDGGTHQVAADRHALTLTGLTNGESYTFAVYAVNAKGSGHKGSARPVMPTSDVPAAPTAITATAAPDGTVTVTWPAANGLGRRVSRYVVTSLSAGAPAPAGQTSGTRLVLSAGALAYGTQYAFSVVSVNDKGGSSTDSTPSNTVVPFTMPGVPTAVVAKPGTAPGTVVVTWRAARPHGRPVTKYVLSDGTRGHDVTGSMTYTVTGLTNGVSVAITVRAVNVAGPGPLVTATARTIDKPAVTAGKTPAASYASITVPFTVNDNGSPTTCSITLNGGSAKSIACTGGKVGGLWPSTVYDYVVTATNNAGNATFTGSQTTPTLSGSVICGDPSYCGPNAPKNGIWVYTTPSQKGNGVGSLYDGNREKTVCWTTGSVTIDATTWGGKRDQRWIRIYYKGENYIPFAWFRLDGGDDPSVLPHC